MEFILANRSASISELKKNPTFLIQQSNGEPIAILNHNKPTSLPKGSLISLWRGTASIKPFFGLIHRECDLPSRFR